MKKPPVRAFSLIEVTLALGIVSFCLVALIGLMPVGVESLRDADRQAEAVRLLQQLTASIRGASRDEAGLYRFMGFDDLSRIVWTADGISYPPHEGFLDRAGTPVSRENADFAYRIELTAPNGNDPASYGKASIRLAWPAVASWSGKNWNRAQGSEEVLILFRESR